MKTLRTWSVVASAAVMAGSLAACGRGSTDAAPTISMKTTTTAKAAPTPSHTPSSSQSPKNKTSTAPSSVAPKSQAPACTTAALDKPLREANLHEVSGQYATVGHNPTCMDDWWIENVYDAGDAMAILHWTNDGWRLVTSSNMSICESQLEKAGAPASVISYAKQSGGLAPTCGTPAMSSPFGSKTATTPHSTPPAVTVPAPTKTVNDANKITLGLPNMGQEGGGIGVEGYGSTHPTLVSAGGDGSTSVMKIHWSNWGAPMATGTGMAMDPYADPSLPIAAQPLAPIKVAAYGLTTCGGHPAYSHFVQYFDQHGETLRSVMAKEKGTLNLCGK